MFTTKEQKIIAAVRSGGETLKINFGKNLRTYRKTIASDFFTEADIKTETRIISLIKKVYPGINILAEESGVENNGSDYTLVIDPLDGTNNFALNIPYFSVAVALMEGEKTVFACVYNPILNDLYCAKLGKGAYKNGRRMKVSRKTSLSQATIAYVTGYSNIKDLRLSMTKKLYHKFAERILDNWCPTLDYCLLAEGKIECVITDDDDLHESIIGKLFITESGGIVTDYRGEKSRGYKEYRFISANGKKILNEVLRIVNHKK
ncbi:hypothetical protein A2303_04935 [Candidatus Falkowbacteria bacterium RIFOXYB2_FULL_47_14]|uniref:Inositol-phosphate phosphatase n=1 Tax=Candidatus Falkowbacteria bacterium RIFOXYA2_FULL_47_19 TaxID=1797994 RepID=A0A1F5SHC0_9BACT|nr:MAG: hypothetical protein A2227_02770 [Candidatus Falkowbacteria bacterium RIFOXYA2_FULL_47_19]OGF34331.1 MAG: hypothetical protein A2468_04275 [Candidatus Falkowbacteria bacterium RIFOXYC2_FULL_46_15]OGF42720.1 MAG: hypothetical protein A2303_04935 [Candidatus Falkowbacteria bacterium RIFOXYB2_FULL_47_14]